MSAPQVGDAAPDFDLPATSSTRVKLSALRGKTVVLAFYPGDFTPVCTKQLCSYRDSFPKLEGTGAVMLPISTDDLATHERFKAEKKLPFELLSDADAKVCASYGVKGLLGGAKRALFVIDPEGVVRFRKDEFLSLTYRDADEIKAAIAAIPAKK